MPQPIALNFKPGVQRDGTRLDSDSCIDALWARFRLGRPRKMGGYHLATDLLGGIGRRVHMFYKGTQIIIHVGTSATLDQIILDRDECFSAKTKRHPYQMEYTHAVAADGTVLAKVVDSVSGDAEPPLGVPEGGGGDGGVE
jgi:CO/xanthine dehydrogenase Mo-binding subunit